MSTTLDSRQVFHNLKKRLRDARIVRGWSPVDVAKMTKISISTISMLEKESCYRSQIHTAIAIAQVLELDESLHSILSKSLSEQISQIKAEPLTVEGIFSRFVYLMTSATHTIKRNSGSYYTKAMRQDLYDLDTAATLNKLKDMGYKRDFLCHFLNPLDLGSCDAEQDTQIDYDLFLISTLIKCKRIGVGLSQSDLAAAIDVSEQDIERLEDDGIVAFKTLIACLVKLNCFDPSNTVFLKQLPFPKTIGERVQQLLHYKLLTQAQFAKESGIKPKYVTSILRNENYLLLSLVEAVRHLQCTDELASLFVAPNQPTVAFNVIESQMTVDLEPETQLRLRIAKVIKEHRESQQRSLKDFASSCNISVEKVKRFEKSGELMMDQFIAMADRLGLSQQFAAFVHHAANVDCHTKEDGGDQTLAEIINSMAVIRRQLGKTYRYIVETTPLTLASLANLFKNNSGSLRNFLHLVYALEIETGMHAWLDSLESRAKENSTAAAWPTRPETQALTYGMVVAAYKQVRKKLDLNQSDVKFDKNKAYQKSYERFERQGIISIEKWISINVHFGLRERLFDVFGNKIYRHLCLSMSQEKLILLLLGQRLREAREAKYMNRTELAKLAKIDERVVFNIEDGLGGKLSTLFELFNILGIAHQLLLVVSEDQGFAHFENQHECISYTQARAVCILLADRFQSLRVNKGISVEKLSGLSGVTVLKIDRFENSGMVTLPNFMAIARVIWPQMQEVMLEPARCTLGGDWEKQLKRACSKQRHTLNQDELELAAAAGIHLRELIRFESTGIISLEGLVSLYQNLFSTFDIHALIDSISMKEAGESTASKWTTIELPTRGFPASIIDNQTTVQHNFATS